MAKMAKMMKMRSHFETRKWAAYVTKMATDFTHF